MKTTLLVRFTILTIVLVFSISAIKAQNPTPTPVDTTNAAMDSTPVTSPTIAPAAVPATTTTAPPAAAPTAAPPPAETAPSPKPEKEKKEGFNSHTRFGIRGGGIISKTDFESTSPSEDPESKIGADLAILAAFPIGGGFLMLQPELHWLQKGYKIPDALTGDDITSTLNYLELPLLLRVNFGGSIRIFAFAGPSIGYLLDGEISDGTQTRDAADYLDPIEYSGHLGLGVGLGTFEVDIRYMAGLSDISDTEDLSDVKNSSFGAGLTLKF